jgi:hypothetical protein
MNRSVQAVPVAYASFLSSSTSTASITSIDLGPYFNVGKREIKFAVSLVCNSTLTTYGTVTLWQGSSVSTANSTVVMTAISDAAGTALTLASTATATTSFQTMLQGMVTERYIQARYIGSTSTGAIWAVTVFALPVVRAI